MIFTDAHSSSAVCSPSRYSVLTGRYNWRSSLQKGIVGLYGDPLISPDRLTVPGFLKQHGYHTACIGKWHLGQGWNFEPSEKTFHPGGFQRHRDTIGGGADLGDLVCLSDLMATCADILGEDLPDNAGEDRVSMMPLFSGTGPPGRTSAVHHSISGKFAIRNGRWKLVLCPGSGGWTYNDANAAKDGLPLIQLYDMQADHGEMRNVHTTRPDKVKELVALLKKQVADGRSTPGPRMANDVPVDIWKRDTMPGVSPGVFDDY